MTPEQEKEFKPRPKLSQMMEHREAQSGGNHTVIRLITTLKSYSIRFQFCLLVLNDERMEEMRDDDAFLGYTQQEEMKASIFHKLSKVPQ